MGEFGIDYAWGVPNITVFKRMGVHFAGGYLSPDPSKNITAAEYRAFEKAGMGMISFWESTASRALDGKSAGEHDAEQAVAQIKQLGGPYKTAPVLFTQDFGSYGGAWRTDAYHDGTARVIGKYRAGKYGDYEACARHLSRGYHYVCQTYAWSGGRWDPRAQLRQYSNGHTIAGLSVDFDTESGADYGQWGYVHPAPKPMPEPKRGPLKPRPEPKPAVMTPALWHVLLGYIRLHYAPANWGRAWHQETSNPAHAYALLKAKKLI